MFFTIYSLYLSYSIHNTQAMKKSCYFILLLGTIFLSFPLQAQNEDVSRLSALEYLIVNNLSYSTDIPIDSAIVWGKKITPILETEKQMEQFFRIKQFMVRLYSERGDIGQAIDEARLMYEKAVSMNHSQGLALSNRAIGDAYYCSNMLPKAIESYKEAINYQASMPENDYFKERTIIKLITSLVLENRMEEAERYREELQHSKGVRKNKTLHFFNNIVNATFYMKKGDLPAAQKNLAEAQQIYETDPQPYLYFFLDFLQGKYSEANGDYTTALQVYNKHLNNIPRKYNSVNYLYIAHTKAILLIKMGEKKEAARLYQEIGVVKDSIVAPSYAHRINSLRATFEENRIKIESKAELNHILIRGASIGLIILIIMIYLVVHILKQNKKLTESKIHLEQARLNAENAMHTKSLFLSNMSHEIRTPLSAISGFSGLLTDQELDEETRHQCTEIIRRNSDLLLKLINDVIDLSNLGTGNMKFNFDYYDAIAICQNVIDTVNNVKQTKAEVLFKNQTSAPLQLYTDNSRLQQLLINLLINATKFTPQGSITLEVERQSEHTALFSVTDTGCGIAPDKRNKIFSRFEKLNENVQGSGLGLSICQLIVEKLGGEIWLDANYTNGCKFCFTHPIDRHIQK